MIAGTPTPTPTPTGMTQDGTSSLSLSGTVYSVVVVVVVPTAPPVTLAGLTFWIGLPPTAPVAFLCASRMPSMTLSAASKSLGSLAMSITAVPSTSAMIEPSR